MKILGISLGHDSGASLVVDGYLKFAINEERLSRRKLHVGYLTYQLSYYQKQI